MHALPGHQLGFDVVQNAWFSFNHIRYLYLPGNQSLIIPRCTSIRKVRHQALKCFRKVQGDSHVRLFGMGRMLS